MALREQLTARRTLTSWQYRIGSFLFYFYLTCLLYGFKVFDNTLIIDYPRADQAQEVWFLAWPAYAISHLFNFFHTDFMNNPHGLNLMTNTSMPLLGLLGAPITWIFGPVVTFTLMMRLAFVTSAMSVQWVGRRLGLSRPAAIAAGMIYGFSTIQLVEGNGHLFLVFVPLPPLIFYSVYALIMGRWSPRFAGLMAGGLLAADFLISAERVLMTVIVLVVTLIIAAVVCINKITLDVLKRLVIGGLWAAAIAGTLLIIPLVAMGGAGHVSGVSHPWIQSYETDLYALVWPGPFTWFDPFHVQMTPWLHSLEWENGSYFGVPLLALVVATAILGWRRRLVVVGAIASFVVIGMSMGEVLKVNGVVSQHHSPYKALTTVKYVENILPLRYIYFAWLGVALVAAYGLDRLYRWHLHRPRHGSTHLYARTALVGGLFALIVLTLLPSHRYKMAPTDVSPWFQSAEMTRVVPTNSVVLFYPYPTLVDNHPILIQAVSSFHYKLIGGEAIVGNAQGVNVGVQPLSPLALPSVFIRSNMKIPTGSVSPLPVRDLPDIPPLDAQTIRDFRTFVVIHHVRTIMMEETDTPGALTVLEYLKASFGLPLVRDHAAVFVWTHAMLDHAGRH